MILGGKPFENIGKGDAVDNLNEVQMMISVFDRVENIVEKRMLVTSFFFFFPQCFQMLYFTGWLKVGIVWYRVEKKNNRLQAYFRTLMTV